MREIPYWLKEFHEETEDIRKRNAEMEQETRRLRQQTASLRALRELNRNPEAIRQIVQNSLIKSTLMLDYTLEQAAQDLRSIGDRLEKNTETLAANNKKLREMTTTLASCHLVSKDDLLDTQAAASYLGVTQPDTIRNWLMSGSFPGAFMSRGQWFFPMVELVKVKQSMEDILAFSPDGKVLEPTD